MKILQHTKSTVFTSMLTLYLKIQTFNLKNKGYANIRVKYTYHKHCKNG